MNKVSLVGYTDEIPGFFEAYIDLTQVIAIRQLSDRDKAFRGLENMGALVHLVTTISGDVDKYYYPVQKAVGWIVPGLASEWADQVETEKIRHKR